MNLATVTPWLPAAADLRLFSPELILVATIAAVLFVPLFTGRRPLVAALIAVVGCLAGLQAAGAFALNVADGGESGLTPPGATPLLVADRFSAFFKLFLLMLLVLITWLWMTGARQRDGESAGTEMRGGAHEFFVLLLTSALGMMLMVSTLNLLVIIVAIETASLPSYAIVASDKRSRLGAEAALKYVMFGAASAAIMVYGASLLYGRFGTLDLTTIASRVTSTSAHGAVDPIFWLGLLALGVGIAFKIAVVPMHLWCPDVFEGAPIEVTTWLSIASKAAGLGLLLRLVDTFGATPALVWAVAPLTWGIGALAAITCTVGNLAALRQESVKRILAYSSIAHAGYMMMAGAILVGPLRGEANIGMAAVVAYLLVYVTMNVGAFGATALVVWHSGSDHLSAFTGLGRRAPWLALPMAVCLFSLVGLPPLGGFAAKWFLLLALGKTAAVQPWLWGLVIVAVVNTALSLYYYVGIVRKMYLTDDPALPAFRPPLGGLALVNACAVMLLVLGTLWFSRLGSRAESLATGIFQRPVATQTAAAVPLAGTPQAGG
jgi:NADH-quinone oxidoreductase subunit N